MKRLLIVAVFALLLAGLARIHAEENAGALNALSLINQTKTKILSKPAAQVDFQQETVSALTGDSVKAAGTVIVQPPAQLKWEYRTPEPYWFLVKDGRLMMVQPRDKQAFIGQLEDSYDSRLPLAILFRDYPLEKNYSSAVQELKQSDAQWEILLTPLQQNPQVKQIKVQIKADYSLVSVETLDQLGNRNVFRFGELTPVKSDESWRLEAPGGFQRLNFEGDPLE